MDEDGRSGLIILRQTTLASTPSPTGRRGGTTTAAVTAAATTTATTTHNGRALRTPHSPLKALESALESVQALDNDYCDLPPAKDDSPRLGRNNNTTNTGAVTGTNTGTGSKSSTIHTINADDRPLKSKFIIVPSSEKSPNASLKVVTRQPSRTASETNAATSRTPLHVDGGKGADLCPYCGLCRCERCRATNRLPAGVCCAPGCAGCPRACACSPEKCLERATCVCCVQGLFYHCAEDTEDDYRYADEPCSCHAHKRCLRFAAMGALSAVALPCLWCYWPGRAGLECLRLCRAKGRKGCECVDDSNNKPVHV